MKLVKKLYNKTIRRPYSRITSYANKLGKKKKCYICGNTFDHFLKYHGGNDKIPEFRKRLELVDSDRDQFGCPYCNSFDRERHLFMYFDKANIWERFRNARILHFAPEKNLSRKIKKLSPKEYVLADFSPKNDGIKKVDATSIPYKNDSFDVVICNHVLEHIPEYYKAMQEIQRVLLPGGMAILQTPFSKIIKRNFEDENLNTDELRWFFYGEIDHFRIFSQYQFFEDLNRAGFKMRIVEHTKTFEEYKSKLFGVNKKEDLIRVFKK